MGKRQKISFETINPNWEPIDPIKLAESRKRISDAMNKFLKRPIVKKR